MVSERSIPVPDGLTRKIIIGMFAGFVVGAVLNVADLQGMAHDLVIAGVLHVGGSLFLASLKLLVVPLVFVSLVCGTAALDDIAKLGRVGGKTLGLYLLTTGLAITFAISVAVVLQPGAGFDLPTTVDFAPKESPPLSEVLIGLFPSNPVRAMADGKMLQIIIFACLFGLTLTLAGEPGQRLHRCRQESEG